MARRPAKVKVKAPTRVRKSALQDPKWDGCENWTGEQFHRAKQSASDYYYRNYKASDLIDYAYHWMRENGYDKEDVKCAKADKGFNITQQTGFVVCSQWACQIITNHNEYWKSFRHTR